jgi:hypothetical protein
MKFPPILIPAPAGAKPDGFVDNRPVTLVSYDERDLLIQNRSAFDRKHGGDVLQAEQKRLRGFLNVVDAFRGEKRQKLRDVAQQLASLERRPALLGEIEKDPMSYVQKELNDRAAGASLALWQQRSSGNLSVGIFCDAGLTDALGVLILLHIGLGRAGRTGSCIVCGDVFERTRGDRRKTCSDRCRKRASRKGTHLGDPRLD